MKRRISHEHDVQDIRIRGVAILILGIAVGALVCWWLHS